MGTFDHFRDNFRRSVTTTCTNPCTQIRQHLYEISRDEDVGFTHTVGVRIKSGMAL